jgi:hypothetical protein
VVAHVSKGGMAEGVAAQVRTAAQVRVAAQVGVAGWRLRREALYEGCIGCRYRPRPRAQALGPPAGTWSHRALVRR